MSMDYKSMEAIAVKRLSASNDPNASPIRKTVNDAENEFYRTHIQNQRVLVAGCGLGNESRELVKYNKIVVGVDLLNLAVSFAGAQCLGIDNLVLLENDFFHTSFPDAHFDSSLLNMGTIGDFCDEDKSRLIREMLRVSRTFYADFYIDKNWVIRKQMYEQEGFEDVHFRQSYDGRHAFVSSDGLYSEILSRKIFDAVVASANAKAQYHDIHAFMTMAEITSL